MIYKTGGIIRHLVVSASVHETSAGNASGVAVNDMLREYLVSQFDFSIDLYCGSDIVPGSADKDVMRVERTMEFQYCRVAVLSCIVR